MTIDEAIESEKRDYNVNGINVLLNHYGCIDWTGRDKNLDLCTKCTDIVINFIKSRGEKKE